MNESEILKVALRLHGEEREAFLDAFCLGDSTLRQRIEARLANESDATPIVEPNPNSDLASVTTSIEVQTGQDDFELRSSDANSESDQMADELEIASDLKPGAWVGPYQLKQRLGQGGMGEVWRAVQNEPVRREVALKVIRAGIGSKEILARFAAERQALALMNHPNIAKILDAGTTPEGQPYFVMELVLGTRLTTYCDQLRLSVAERLQLFIDVCSGVQHAHQKGIIHRDLKPGNIIVGIQDGKPVPKIIDFGLAKAMGAAGQLTEQSLLTNIGQILGTLKYMSPEQASLDPVDIDTRTDIYALGVILYELLTGSTPLDDPSIKGQAALKVLEYIRDHDPVKPSSKLSSISHEERSSVTGKRRTDNQRLSRALAGDLDWIVMKALERDRGRRYESASGFAADIARFLNNEPVTARPPSMRYRIGKFARKNRVGVTVAVILFVSLLAGVIGTSWGLRQAILARDAESLAREAETKAKERETAQRLAAERQQKLAEVAAEQERLAKEESNRRLNQIELINEAVFDIFAGFDIKQVKQGTDPVEYVLGNRLAEMGKQLDADAINDPLILANLLNRLGNTLVSLGLNQEAIEFLKSALKLRGEILGNEHDDTITTTNNLAAAYRANEQFDLAMPLYENAYELRRENLGDKHPNTLISLSNMALGYGSRGQYDRAIPMLEEVLKLRRETLGETHADTMSTISNLATGYLSAGEPNRAIPLFEEVLARYRELASEDQSDFGMIMSNLAAAYESSGQVEKAIPLFEEALRFYRERFGRDHPETLTSLNNLAYGFQQNRQPAQALPLFEELLKLSIGRFGDEHPKSALAKANLGALHLLMGNHQAASPLLEQALRVYEVEFGDSHPKTVSVLNSLAVVYRATNRNEEALAIFERSLKVLRETLGDDHPSTLNALNNSAASYLTAGQAEKSVPLFELALEKFRDKFGDEHPMTMNGMNNLAAAYIRLNRIADAIPLLEELINLQRTKLGADHPETIKRIVSLASQYRSLARFDQAIPLYQEVLNWRESNQGAEHPETMDLMNTLGASYWANDQVEQAIPVLEETLKRMEKVLGRDHSTTQATLGNLGISYRDAGRAEEGLPMLEEAYRTMGDTAPFAWLGPQLLTTYVQQDDHAKAVEFGTELLAQAKLLFPEKGTALARQLVAICRDLKNTDQTQEVKTAIVESIAILEQEQADDWQFFEAKTILGVVCVKQGDHDEANLNLVQGYEGLAARASTIPPIRRSILKSTLESLIQLSELTNRPEEKAKWEAELQKTRLCP